jgi:hypothetical protein
MNNNKKRIILKASNPKKEIINFFTKKDFSNSIQKNRDFVKNVLLENPYETYINFRNRLSLYGHNAQFPEFEGVPEFLIEKIFQTKEIYDFYQEPNNIILFHQLINKLLSIKIKNRFNYPYKETIYCIESLLEVLDNYYRLNQTEKNEYPEYYHSFRFRLYLSSFFENEYGFPDSIIFPTIFNFGATHLIQIRSVPIYILGVFDKPVYVDKYIHTPLDFWTHDIGHATLQLHETMRYFDMNFKHSKYEDERTIFSIKKPAEFYNYMSNFTKDVIIPNIKINKTKDSIKLQKIKAMAKMIIFEIVHENSYVITKEKILSTIKTHNGFFPSEYYYINNSEMVINTKVKKTPIYSIEELVFQKLNGDFFNKKVNRKDYIVPINFRTKNNIKEGIKYIIDFL